MNTNKHTEPDSPAAANALPTLPRPRMPLSQRAKIFIPFDPLHGYQDALRAKELEVERSFDAHAREEYFSPEYNDFS